jgi:hypothetical protein
MYDEASRFAPPAQMGWPGLPQAPGELAHAIAQQLPGHYHQPYVPASTALEAAAIPAESASWMLVKHASLVCFATMAVMIALFADASLALVAGYVAAAFLSIVTFMVADRARFLEHEIASDAAMQTTAALAAATAPQPVFDPLPITQPFRVASALAGTVPAHVPQVADPVASYAPQLPQVPSLAAPRPAAQFTVSVT